MANYTSIYASGQAVDQALQRGEEAWTKINSGEVGGGKIEMLYNGTNITVDGTVVNFKQIVDYLTVDNKFTYLLYNNMAYLTTKIDTISSLKQVVFESSHVDGGMGKIFTITVNSSDGVTIASINHTNVANENYSNKVSSIAENDKKSTVHYPSNKAVTDITDNKVDKDGSKVLSDNNYTTVEKQKLAGLSNYDDSAIKAEIGAVVNSGAKNLLNIEQIKDSGKYGIVGTVENGIITLVGNSTASTTSDYYIFYEKPLTLKIRSAVTFIVEGTEVQLWYKYVDNRGEHYAALNNSQVISAGVTITRLYFKIQSNTTYNTTIKIMLRDASIEDSTFVPYAPSNRELYEMILALTQGTSTMSYTDDLAND